MKSMRSSPLRSSINQLIILVVMLAILLIWLILFRPGKLRAFSCNGNLFVHETATASNGFFMENQVILTGPRDNVEAVVDTVQTNLAIRLVKVKDCDLSYLSDRTVRPPIIIAPTNARKRQTETLYTNQELDENQRNSLVMRLYKIDGNRPTDEVISEINNIGNKNPESKMYVFADPNYLTDALDENSGSCGYPFSGGGSSLSTPFSGGGSPYAGFGTRNPSPSVEDFTSQWAFQSSTTIPGGISLSSEFGSPSTDQVHVGVFDTSPWRETTLNKKVILPDRSSFDLILTNAVETRVNVNNPPNYNIRDHGLFVVGLIRAVAPNSNIHLIRVLNDDGCGDLWTINTALQHFISQMSSNRERPNLYKVVISLSFGIHKPDEEYMKMHPEVDWAELEDELFSLEETIGNATELGAIVVAAAGNDSAGLTTPAPAQFPAIYEPVIAVAASNSQGQWSCYSNEGEFAAPGGDGGEIRSDDDESKSNPCAARAKTWNAGIKPCMNEDMANCGYGVLSLAKRPASANSTEYVFWVGTSFSTPLVSGLAAQALDKMQGDQEKAICLIEKGASLISLGPNDDWGIINITESFSNDVIAQCTNPPPID